MVTTTIYVKPYLAAYMYVRYQNSVVTELNAIRLKSIENLYHVIKNLTVKRPRDVSWRESDSHNPHPKIWERTRNIQLPGTQQCYHHRRGNRNNAEN